LPYCPEELDDVDDQGSPYLLGTHASRRDEFEDENAHAEPQRREKASRGS
jgi:hypothetical protein